jgi:hypothetical protein
VLTLLSGNSGTAGGAFFAGATADGSRVFFETDEQFTTLGDLDTGKDVYRSEGGVLAFISQAGTSNDDVEFRRASTDGSRAFFTTMEPISGTGDNDTALDVYRREGAVTTLLSGVGANLDADFAGATADGSSVFFETTQAFGGTGDVDAGQDVYRSQGGVITLVTGSGSNDPANFNRISADGSRIFFSTPEPIPGKGDGDTTLDVYRVEGGVTTLVTGGLANVNAVFSDTSTDGSRLLFTSNEPLPGTPDADTARDVYRAENGVITLLSGGVANTTAAFEEASDDGSRVFFQTSEAIPGTGDADTATDDYVSRIVPPPITPNIPPSVAPPGKDPRCKSLLKKLKKTKSKKGKKRIRAKRKKLGC